jgi:uncharacterized membrane protein
MSDSKTIPAALEAMLRPRRMRRIHSTVARSRAEGAWFDAMLWSVFALIAVAVLASVLHFADPPVLAQLGIEETHLVAGGVLLAIVIAATLWWRWFKWRVHAIDDAGSHDGEPPAA